ncbi:MAG: trypsin-like peptidase domain-containing protein [Myxococcales bacterium]
MLVAVAVCFVGCATIGRPLGARRSARYLAIHRALPQSVRIQVFAAGALGRTASGVCLADDRPAHRSYVLTNAHVVERGDLPGDPVFRVVVEGPRGTSRTFSARLLAKGSVPGADLALLEVPGVDLVPAELAPDESPEVGEAVVVIGAPFGRELSVSSGLVSSIVWSGGEGGRIQDRIKTDASIGYGTSGGGVFRVRDGALVAVIEGYRTARVEMPLASQQNYGFDIPMPGETFAAPAAKIRRFLSAQGLAWLLGGKHPGVGVASK